MMKCEKCNEVINEISEEKEFSEIEKRDSSMYDKVLELSFNVLCLDCIKKMIK